MELRCGLLCAAHSPTNLKRIRQNSWLQCITIWFATNRFLRSSMIMQSKLNFESMTMAKKKNGRTKFKGIYGMSNQWIWLCYDQVKLWIVKMFKMIGPLVYENLYNSIIRFLDMGGEIERIKRDFSFWFLCRKNNEKSMRCDLMIYIESKWIKDERIWYAAATQDHESYYE